MDKGFIVLMPIFVFALVITHLIANIIGRNSERSRFEKEAVSHGYGTYELSDDSESKYIFEWKELQCLHTCEKEKDHDLGKLSIRMEKSSGARQLRDKLRSLQATETEPLRRSES